MMIKMNDGDVGDRAIGKGFEFDIGVEVEVGFGVALRVNFGAKEGNRMGLGVGEGV